MVSPIGSVDPVGSSDGGSCEPRDVGVEWPNNIAQNQASLVVVLYYLIASSMLVELCESDVATHTCV